MEEIFNSIVEKVKACSRERKMFNMPHFEGYQIIETENQAKGAVLFSKDYKIEKDNKLIEVAYQSKDKSRTFQNNPDRSSISISWKENGNTKGTYSDSWDE